MIFRFSDFFFGKSKIFGFFSGKICLKKNFDTKKTFFFDEFFFKFIYRIRRIDLKRFQSVSANINLPILQKTKNSLLFSTFWGEIRLFAVILRDGISTVLFFCTIPPMQKVLYLRAQKELEDRTVL